MIKTFLTKRNTKSEYVLRWRVNFALLLLSVVEGCINVGNLAFLIRATGTIAGANLLTSGFWLAMTVAELPTGYYSDIWGPRFSLLLSIGLRVFAFLLFFLGYNSQWMLVLANVLAGIAVTFMTGTFSMQLKLVARKYNLQINFDKFAAQASAFRYAGLVLGSGLGFYFINYWSLKTIWLGGISASMLFGLYVWLFWEPVTGEAQRNPIKHFGRAIQVINQNGRLRIALLLNATLLLLTLSILNNWVIVFVPSLENTPGLLVASTMGILFFRSVIATAWTSLALWRLPNLSLVFLGLGAMMALAAVPVWSLRLMAFILSLLCVTGSEIFIRKLIIEELPEDEAGSVSSIQSLFENLAGTLGFIGLGYFLAQYSVETSWIFSGVCMSGLYLLLYWQGNLSIFTQNKPEI